MTALKWLSRPKPEQRLGYSQGSATTLNLLPVAPGMVARSDAAMAFLRMAAAAAAAGVQLTLNSAFRSMEEQEELYQRYLNQGGALAARPGYSNHQGGIAFDIATGGLNTPTYAWLAANAARHGFIRTVPSEPWHWEFRPGEKGVST